jgi:hypothetical protein
MEYSARTLSNINMFLKLFVFFLLFLNFIHASSLSWDKDVILVARQVWDERANHTDIVLKGSYEPLQFRFNPLSHINGWWCVNMYERSTPGWLNNYLCTKKDIGLEWSWARETCPTTENNSITPKKCVWVPEPHDPSPSVWADNALCLPLNAKIELIWSWCGPIPQLSCVHLYDADAPTIFNDNFICWKEN